MTVSLCMLAVGWDSGPEPPPVPVEPLPAELLPLEPLPVGPLPVGPEVGAPFGPWPPLESPMVPVQPATKANTNPRRRERWYGMFSAFRDGTTSCRGMRRPRKNKSDDAERLWIE